MKKNLVAVIAVIMCIGMAFAGNGGKADARETKKTDVDWLVTEKILSKEAFSDVEKICKAPENPVMTVIKSNAVE